MSHCLKPTCLYLNPTHHNFCEVSHRLTYSDRFSIDQKRVIITGASRGISKLAGIQKLY